MNQPKILLAVGISLRFLIRMYLRKYGCTLIEYQDGIRIKPDLIIFDKNFLEIIGEFASEEIQLLMIATDEYKSLLNNESRKITYLKEPLAEVQFINEIKKVFGKISETENNENFIEYQRSKKKPIKEEKFSDSAKKSRVKKRILVADDDEGARTLLKKLLSDGYEIIEVEDGRSLVEKAALVNPDLIISDIVMPYLSGWRAVKKIRENPFLKNIPVIFYSSFLKDHELYHTLKPSGPSVFLFKPYELKQMRVLIEKMIGE